MKMTRSRGLAVASVSIGATASLGGNGTYTISATIAHTDTGWKH